MRNKTEHAKAPVTVNFYLDTRRKKDNDSYPMKIRVYDTITKKARLYTTDFDLTIEDNERLFFPVQKVKYNKYEKQLKIDLESLLTFYESKVHSLKSFTFEAFEKSLSTKSSDLDNVFYNYDSYINELKEYNRYSTAISYEYSMNSLKAYLKDRTKKEVSRLLFQDITVKFLNDFESWMIDKKKKSITTVGMYLRALRSIYNRAIENKITDALNYPFGSKRYEIPASTNTKKAFDSDQLTVLFKSIPGNKEQEKAKDFWFFSFVCNGMNIKDIIHLKWSHIDNDQIIFIREKTKRTKKANAKPIQVPLTEFSKTFISKYGIESNNKNDFIFPILNENMKAEELHKKKTNFIRFVNQHLKVLAKANGLTEDISSYWARHSFATTAIRKKASMEYVSEALGHSDLKTTKNYFAGFEDKTKKEVLEGIIDFMK